VKSAGWGFYCSNFESNGFRPIFPKTGGIRGSQFCSLHRFFKHWVLVFPFGILYFACLSICALALISCICSSWLCLLRHFPSGARLVAGLGTGPISARSFFLARVRLVSPVLGNTVRAVGFTRPPNRSTAQASVSVFTAPTHFCCPLPPDSASKQLCQTSFATARTQSKFCGTQFFRSLVGGVRFLPLLASSFRPPDLLLFASALCRLLLKLVSAIFLSRRIKWIEFF
jgi:hypothetical protein